MKAPRIITRLKQIFAYADNIVIIERTKQILIDTFCKFKHEALKAQLIVITKPNIYIVPEKQSSLPT